MSDITGQLEVKSSTFIWKIDNFSEQCSNVGEIIKSPIFELKDSKKKSCWTLALYPFGNKADVKDNLSLFLTFLPQSTVREYVCSYEISLVSDTQNDESIQKGCKKEVFGITRTWGWRRFMKRSELFEKENTLLKQNTLTISCSIIEISVDRTETDHVISSLADEYESLYVTGDFSDVTIIIGDKKIKAHKAILSAKSKVFSAMLKHDMAEVNSNTITITDVEFNVMEKFVSFLYSRNIVDLKEFAKPLLAVANKYDVSDLKLLCENTLLSSLTVDNACELVSMTELYNCCGLQSKIIDYMVENMREIMKTESFECLLSSNQTLFKKIFSQLVETRCIKSN